MSSSTMKVNFFVLYILLLFNRHPPLAIAVRFVGDPILSNSDASSVNNPISTSTAIFALGSFWRAEAVFGCLSGVVRTTAGYCGGWKQNPEYRSTGNHAEAVEVEYDAKVVKYEQLLHVFWSNHDPTQVFGQGPDVGEQYRSVIFVQSDEQNKLAVASQEREQAKLDNIITTRIQQLEAFYPAEPEHQKFELRRKPALMTVLGNFNEEELAKSPLATKLNAYAAGMCPTAMQKVIDAKLAAFFRNWSKLRQSL